MSFNPQTDKIAMVIREFTLIKSSEIFFNKYSEPYIVSIAIDENGKNNPSISFSATPFPKVKKGKSVKLGNHGQLVYGPKNPGEFMAYSILFMESDKDVREAAETVESIMNSNAVKLGLQAIATANPTAAMVKPIVEELANLVAEEMKKNKDDEIFRISGTVLRGMNPPYNIRKNNNLFNDYVRTQLKVLPLAGVEQINEHPLKTASL